MPKHYAKAVWEGDLPHGKGKFILETSGYEAPYTFSSRFEDGKGSSPEELIGAAHSGCFSMAFSNILAQAGFTPDRVETRAEVRLEKGESGFSITRVTLRTKGKVPGISNERFQELAKDAKENCPVSRALKAVPIELEAELL